MQKKVALKLSVQIGTWNYFMNLNLRKCAQTLDVQ